MICSCLLTDSACNDVSRLVSKCPCLSSAWVPGCRASPHWGCWSQTLTHGCARTFRWNMSVCLDVHAAGVSAIGQNRMADRNAESAVRYRSTLAMFSAQAQRRDVVGSLVLYIALRQGSVGTANLAAVWATEFEQTLTKTLTRHSLICVQVVHSGRTLLLRSFGARLKLKRGHRRLSLPLCW